MEISRQDLEFLIALRMELVDDHKKYRDYKMNNNAIMREIDHIKTVESAIKKLDKLLEKYVKFEG